MSLLTARAQTRDGVEARDAWILGCQHERHLRYVCRVAVAVDHRRCPLANSLGANSQQDHYASQPPKQREVCLDGEGTMLRDALNEAVDDALHPPDEVLAGSLDNHTLQCFVNGAEENALGPYPYAGHVVKDVALDMNKIA